MEKKDKALRRALQKQAENDFPFSLRNKIMASIETEAVRKKKRAYVRNIIFVLVVSILLASGAGYLLALHMGMSFSMSALEFTPESKSLFFSSVFIGAIILSLLVIDGLLRKKYERHKKRFS